MRPRHCCTTSCDQLNEAPDDDWGAAGRLLAAGVDKKTPNGFLQISWQGFVRCKKFSVGNFGCLVRGVSTQADWRVPQTKKCKKTYTPFLQNLALEADLSQISIYIYTLICNIISTYFIRFLHHAVELTVAADHLCGSSRSFAPLLGLGLFLIFQF